MTKSKKLKYRTRPLSQIKKILVHHSATATGTPEAFARYHVEHNGWAGIGYHYVIDATGKVYKTQAATTICNHTAKHNESGLGICLIGNFEQTTPTPAALKALVELCKELMKAYSINAVWGHKELVKTVCPGKNLNMTRVREEIY